jgi:hypothetical protein
VFVDHDVVPQRVEPRYRAGVRSTVAKLYPLTVTVPSEVTAILALIRSVITGASNVKAFFRVPTCAITVADSRTVPYPSGILQLNVVKDDQLVLRHLVTPSTMTVAVVSSAAKFKPNTETLAPPVFGPLNTDAYVVTGAS